MKLFKCFVMVAALAAANLMADYTTITTKTSPSASGGKEIFFGKVEDYTKYVSEIAKNIAIKGADGALNGLSAGAGSLAKGFVGEGLKSFGAGAGIGIVIGLLDPYVMSFYADQEYVLVRADSNGELTAVMFIGDKHPKLSDEQIHNILKNK